MTEAVNVLISELEDLEAKRLDLMSEVKASLAILTLWTDAFEHGPVTTRIQGSHSKGFKLYIKNGIGEEKALALPLIPLELACRDHIKRALKSIVNERCGPSESKREAEALLKELGN
jgi:hypothetical protein